MELLESKRTFDKRVTRFDSNQCWILEIAIRFHMNVCNDDRFIFLS